MVGLEVRTAPEAAMPWIRTYGTIDGGFEVTRAAWPALTHVFSVRRHGDKVESPEVADPKHVYQGHHRYPHEMLNRHPVDLLAVEMGYQQRPTERYDWQPWETVVVNTLLTKRPRVVIEMWPPNAQLWSKGPACKSTIARWHELGYVSRYQRISATQVGGAITQGRLVVARVQLSWSHMWEWGPSEGAQQFPRPMSNLLVPPGLLKSPYYVAGRQGDPDSKTEPMPDKVKAYIHTDKGVRRLLPEETGNGLGIPKAWKIDPQQMSRGLLNRTTSIFHWEYLSSTLARQTHTGNFEAYPTFEEQHDGAQTGDQNSKGMSQETRPGGESTQDPTQRVPFSWKPPNLEPGNEWYETRMKNARYAAGFFPDPDKVVEECVEALKIHRTNYNVDGPAAKTLKLLWWEFPPEHWVPLREGSRMNFLKAPRECIHDNAAMDDEQTRVAVEFVDELLDLGIIQLPAEGQEVLATAPLFVVPKEGQEGQWRVIADMLRGGQNECSAGDPVILPRTGHIVDLLYTGGYSAVIDASKYFHQFPTHPDDRPYLGLRHPVTDVLYEYVGLPMGGSNSPAVACRYGLLFIRMLCERFQEFQGTPKANCWWTGFSEDGYNPDLGYGFTLHGKDGGAVRIWAFVDDFLLHGPTYEKTASALTTFLNLAVDCGMLCHPKKLTPPQQVVKYCGFLLDSRNIPCLRIPIAKRERALAIVDHILEAPLERAFSRLSLAVAAGVLQSLVEATPLRLGNTYMRRFHSLIRPPGLGTGLAPYLTLSCVSEGVRQDMRWWRHFLVQDGGRFARSVNSATFAPMWGDGSGTGTGGTFIVPDGPLRMWKGKWNPAVFHFSSNWKELSTLRLSLLRLLEEGAESVRGTTIFYFTDNSSTYWIAASGSSPSPGLHKLIEEIRLLELELDCSLQVVHVPGYLMIDQGTDSLSRGIWMSSFHDLTDSSLLTQEIFAPLPYDPGLVTSYIQRHGL